MALHAEDFLPPAAIAKLVARLPRRPGVPEPIMRTCLTEEQEQIALFSWARAQEHVYPCLRLLYAIPNGGYRHKTEAVRLAKAGVLAGIPDVCLPVARHGSHALYIELKSLDGHPSDLQAQRAVDLVCAGSLVAFCWGMEQARDCLVWYLGGK